MSFHQSINRLNTAAVKWDGLQQIFGTADVLPMWVADMDFRSPEPVINALKDRIEHGIFGYTLQTPAYNNAIIHWMQQRHGWEIKPEWLQFTPGIVPALSLIVQAFTSPGDKVIIQSPVYPPFYRVVESQDRELVINPLKEQDGHYTMDFEDLESKIDEKVKMIILCSPHNPVGRVWTEQELRQLHDICSKSGILVVSDEIHGDLVYEPYRHIPYAMLSEEAQNNSIICTAPSKTFNIAGLNTSNLIIPNSALRTKLRKLIQQYELGSLSTFGATATIAAYTEGKEWLEQCLAYLQDNRDAVIQFIRNKLPEIVVSVPEATYLIWLDCRALGMTSAELQKFMLHEAKIAFNNGATFGKDGDGFMRMNIACPRQVIDEALARLETAVEHWRQSKTQV